MSLVFHILWPARYKVTVVTGDVAKAGTDANVFIQLFGSESDTGEVSLFKSESHKDPFERNHRDVFHIEAVSVGDLSKVI